MNSFSGARERERGGAGCRLVLWEEESGGYGVFGREACTAHDVAG